jgi:hypothetical protein
MVTDVAMKRFDQDVGDLVGYLLFTDEAPLAEPVQGTSTFTRIFAKSGPRDRKGRSLRDFDLQTHLFRHRLSYMIYTETFEGLPSAIRERVYRRLYDVLTGTDTSEQFRVLSDDERQTVLEILLDTKANLPDYWVDPRSPRHRRAVKL